MSNDMVASAASAEARPHLRWKRLGRIPALRWRTHGLRCLVKTTRIKSWRASHIQAIGTQPRIMAIAAGPAPAVDLATVSRIRHARCATCAWHDGAPMDRTQVRRTIPPPAQAHRAVALPEQPGAGRPLQAEDRGGLVPQVIPRGTVRIGGRQEGGTGGRAPRPRQRRESLLRLGAWTTTRATARRTQYPPRELRSTRAGAVRRLLSKSS